MMNHVVQVARTASQNGIKTAQGLIRHTGSSFVNFGNGTWIWSRAARDTDRPSSPGSLPCWSFSMPRIC